VKISYILGSNPKVIQQLDQTSKLSKQVTTLKKNSPDKAIALLDRLVKLETNEQLKLKHNLRKVTILSDHQRYEEAVKIIQECLEYKLKLKEFDKNLYFKEIYLKAKLVYQKVKMFDQAAVFAAMEFYSKCENDFHNQYSSIHDMSNTEYIDTLTPVNSISSNLKKCGKLNLEPEFMKLIKCHFQEKPTQNKCTKLFHKLNNILEK
jgi:tetratricopeptide (TPR) repeat protein